jgi:hypothetical protein
MNVSDMAHRLTDAVKRIIDKLPHWRGIQPQQSSAQSSNARTGFRDKWDDLT